MEYLFHKDRLPSGHSFPIGRSILDTALQQAQLQHIHAMYYWRRRQGDIVIRADYRAEQAQWVGAGRETLTVYSVPALQKQAIRYWIQTAILPQLMEWLRRAESAGNVWRATGHSIAFHYHNGTTSISEH